MARPFEDFVREYNGTWNDVDGVYGAQCVDGANVYLLWLGYGTIRGNAIDFWTQRNTNGILNYCNVVSSPQNGDIIVYDSRSGTIYGHIGMYYNGQCFGQNQGSSSANGGPFNLLSLGISPVGILRPKCYAEKELWMRIVNGLVIEAREM